MQRKNEILKLTIIKVLFDGGTGALFMETGFTENLRDMSYRSHHEKLRCDPFSFRKEYGTQMG